LICNNWFKSNIASLFPYSQLLGHKAMYIKVKGILIRVVLLAQLGVLLLGYGFLGHCLRILFRDNRLVESLLLLSLSLAATWAISFNLGGLIAVAVTVLISFVTAGLVPSLLTAGAGAAFLFLCLWGDDYEEPERKDQSLNRFDWLVAIITIAFAGIFAFLLLGNISSYNTYAWVSHLLAGGMSGALATVGLQTKSVNLTKSKTVLLLGGLAIAGLAIGAVVNSIWFAFSFRDFI
jgi:hypothetical protein